MMKPAIVLTVLVGCTVAAASAQSPSSTFARGSSLQSWQNPGLKGVLGKCKSPTQPFSIPGGPAANANPAPPPEPPATTAIQGVIAAGQNWKVVWSWEGNNADGIIAGDEGTMLFANNDASNVMKLDPATGLATIVLSPDEKTLHGIVFYGAWGTASARNRVIAIPVLAQGYMGRAK